MATETFEQLDLPPPEGSPSGELGIGLLGCGVVGSAVVRRLTEHPACLTGRFGRRPALRAIAVRHVDKQRASWVPRDLLTGDPLGVVEREDVDVVVEVIGGLDPAGALVDLAAGLGKQVVTANKELLGARWACLGPLALRERRLRLEAAVMAGVPVIGPLAGLAAGDRVLSLEGILNGTTNHCLHRMEDEGIELGEALEEARLLGLAEADPSADVDGRDAAAKLAILASVALGRTVPTADVRVSGIAGLSAADLRAARARGFVLRLLAEAWRDTGGDVVARVGPRWLPIGHPLSEVADHHNGLVVTTELAGSLLFRGPGAGGDATASAVLGDLAGAAHAITDQGRSER